MNRRLPPGVTHLTLQEKAEADSQAARIDRKKDQQLRLLLWVFFGVMLAVALIMLGLTLHNAYDAWMRYQDGSISTVMLVVRLGLSGVVLLCASASAYFANYTRTH